MRREPPEHGWSFSAEVISAGDGDTVDVRVTRIIRIRLLDCWAPETRKTNIPGEKQFGLEVQRRIRELLPADKVVTVFIPASTDDEIKDILTLDRALGRIWVGSDQVSDVLHEEGLVGRTKSELHQLVSARIASRRKRRQRRKKG